MPELQNNPQPTPVPENIEQDEPVTMASLRGLLDSISQRNDEKLTALRNDLFAKVRVEKKSVGRPASNPPSSVESQAVQELENKLQRQSINEKLIDHMEKLGAASSVDGAKYFNSLYGDRISIDETGIAIFEEKDGSQKELGEYLNIWTKSAGSFLIPAVSAPSSHGLRGSTNGPTNKLTPAETTKYRNMDFETLMQNRKGDPQGVLKYFELFPEEVKKKKSVFERSR